MKIRKSRLKCDEGQKRESIDLVMDFIRGFLRCQFGRVLRLTLISIILLPLYGCTLRETGEPKSLPGQEQALAGKAALTCSRECSDRGQCGQSNKGDMVLANSSASASFGHDMAIQSGTLVEIDHAELKNAVQMSNNEILPIFFYMVEVPDSGRAWVAGWCIRQ